jgi:hypothetical protein
MAQDLDQQIMQQMRSRKRFVQQAALGTAGDALSNIGSRLLGGGPAAPTAISTAEAGRIEVPSNAPSMDKLKLKQILLKDIAATQKALMSERSSIMDKISEMLKPPKALADIYLQNMRGSQSAERSTFEADARFRQAAMTAALRAIRGRSKGTDKVPRSTYEKAKAALMSVDGAQITPGGMEVLQLIMSNKQYDDEQIKNLVIDLEADLIEQPGDFPPLQEILEQAATGDGTPGTGDPDAIVALERLKRVNTQVAQVFANEIGPEVQMALGEAMQGLIGEVPSDNAEEAAAEAAKFFASFGYDLDATGLEDLLGTLAGTKKQGLDMNVVAQQQALYEQLDKPMQSLSSDHRVAKEQIMSDEVFLEGMEADGFTDPETYFRYRKRLLQGVMKKSRSNDRAVMNEKLGSDNRAPVSPSADVAGGNIGQGQSKGTSTAPSTSDRIQMAAASLPAAREARGDLGAAGVKRDIVNLSQEGLAEDLGLDAAPVTMPTPLSDQEGRVVISPDNEVLFWDGSQMVTDHPILTEFEQAESFLSDKFPDPKSPHAIQWAQGLGQMRRDYGEVSKGRLKAAASVKAPEMTDLLDKIRKQKRNNHDSGATAKAGL